MSMSHAARRLKGARGEREFCAKLSESFPELGKITRNIGQARNGGEDIGPDMLPGFVIEVKWQETLNLTAWWNQACEQCFNSVCEDSKENIPVLAYKQSKKGWRVRVPLRLFVPFSHINHTVDITYGAFVKVVKHVELHTR